MPKLLAALRTPMAARVAPFVAFAGITSLQGTFGESSKYWLYLVKCMLGAAMVWAVWPVLKRGDNAEIKRGNGFTWDAILVGIIVFVLWVGLEPLYKKFYSGTGKAWNPFAEFGPATATAWMYVFVRIIGSTLIVPPIEEAFYRSFVYRFVSKPDFETVPLNSFHWPSLLITAALFGAVHREWLPGILCGLAYQFLVLRHNRINEAMVAHGITNLLLGCWVVWKGAWEFW